MQFPGRSTLFLVVLVVLLAVGAAAQTPSHPLSQITPSDSNLNLSDNTNLNPYNVTGADWLVPAGSSLNLGGDINIPNGNLKVESQGGENVIQIGGNQDTLSIETSGKGQVAAIGSDTGSNRIELGALDQAATQTGLWAESNLQWLMRDGEFQSQVSEMNISTNGGGGDTITINDASNSQRIAQFKEGGNVEIPSGNLDMSSNKIEDLGSADSSDDAMPKTDIQSTFLNSGGDTMTGDLKLNGHEIKNVDALSNGTARSLEIGSDGGINISSGGLNVSGQLTVGSTACGSDEAILGDGSCGTPSSGSKQNLSDVLAHGATANTSIDLQENALQNVNALQDGSGTDSLRFDGSDNTVLMGNDLKQVGHGSVNMTYSSSRSRVEMRTGGNVDLCFGACAQ